MLYNYSLQLGLGTINKGKGTSKEFEKQFYMSRGSRAS